MSLAHFFLTMALVSLGMFLICLTLTIVKAEWDDYKLQRFNDHVITTPGMRYIGATYSD